MDAIRRLISQQLLPLSIGAAALGIALTILAVLKPVPELKVFAASLIGIGGIGLGIVTGLADPRKLKLPGWMKTWKAVIGIIVGWLVILPVLIVLGMAIAGVFGDGGSRSSTALAIGGVIIVLMILTVVATGVMSLWKIYDASNDDPAEQGASDAEIAQAERAQ